MTDTETYVVIAKTKGSSMSVGTQDPADALKRAREMMGPDSDVTIVDRSGNRYTVAELEANVISGSYSKPAASNR